MPSVTEVIEHTTEPHIVKWYRAKGFTACDKISIEAKRIGSLVDGWIQEDVRQEGRYEPTLPQRQLEFMQTGLAPAEWRCWESWLSFKRDHPAFLESVVGVQEELQEGELVGHPDLIVQDATHWGIVDIKTSKQVTARHLVQVGKYWSMKRHQMAQADPIAGCRLPSFIAILRLDKESGQYEYFQVEDEQVIREQVIVFNAYYRIYQHEAQVRALKQLKAEAEAYDGIS